MGDPDPGLRKRSPRSQKEGRHTAPVASEENGPAALKLYRGTTPLGETTILGALYQGGRLRRGGKESIQRRNADLARCKGAEPHSASKG